MTVKTITVSGKSEVNFNTDGTDKYFYSSQKYIWVKNRSDSSMYISADINCTADADGTSEISAGESGMIMTPKSNKIYISGTGKAEIKTSGMPECPF